MSPDEWRAQWDHARGFCTANGANGERFGNDTINVDPDTATIRMNLPAALAHLSNTPGRDRVYVFDAEAGFAHRCEEWQQRAHHRLSIRYRMSHNADNRRWMLHASWVVDTPEPPELDVLRTFRTLGVDLNAGHIAAYVVTPSGSPRGDPVTVAIPQEGTAKQRDSQLRAAITLLFDIAQLAGCRTVAIENLNFEDARNTGREKMGRGRKGKRFRQAVAGIPTAKFRDFMSNMAANRSQPIHIVAVDPAYTSRWGRKYWLPLLKRSYDEGCSGHHAAAVLIARRGLEIPERRAMAETLWKERSIRGSRPTGCAADVRVPANQRVASARTVSVGANGKDSGGASTLPEPSEGEGAGCGQQFSATPLRAPPNALVVGRGQPSTPEAPSGAVAIE